MKRSTITRMFTVYAKNGRCLSGSSNLSEYEARRQSEFLQRLGVKHSVLMDEFEGKRWVRVTGYGWTPKGFKPTKFV